VQPQQVAQADQAKTASQQIETVTVTATRTAKDIQKVSVAVSAITAKQLEDQAPRTIQDLNGDVPNVFIGMNTAGPGASAIFIRGLGYADIEKTQNPAVGVSLDGVFFGTSTGQLLDTFDVSQVEVERGPQGIFFGKNTTGGVINVIRSAPTREWGFKGSASYGSFDSTVLRAIVNAPLGDNGGIKIGGTWRYNYGDDYNVFTGKHAGGDRYMAINGVVDYDLTDFYNVRFSVDHLHEHGGGSPVQFGNILTASILGFTGLPTYNPTTGSPDGLGIHEIENNFLDKDIYDNTILNLINTFQTGIGELVLQTAFIDSDDLVDQDFDGTCAPDCATVGNPLLPGSVLHTIRDQTYRQFTQEARLTGTIWDHIDYLAGVFYYHHDISLHQTTNGIVNQFSGEGNNSVSVFGNLDWNITDRFKISTGARTINENKNFRTAYFVGTTIPITPDIRDKHKWSDVITRFAAQYQVTDESMVYASRSEGFRSGGFSIRGTLSEQNPTSTNCGVPVTGCPNNNFLTYEPEKVVAYELGSKNAFLDNAVVFNAAGFFTTVKGFQFNNVVVTPGYGPGTNTYISNLPKVEIKGFEFDLTVAGSHFGVPGLTLNGNFGLQKAKIVDGVIDGRLASTALGTAGAPGSTADFTGQTLARVPDYNFGIRGTYVTQIGDGAATVTMAYNYTDKFSLGNFATLPDIQPAYGLLDAGLSYALENYRISLTGKNLTNKAYRNNSLPTVFFQGWGDPRTWMVEIDVDL
jgi:iron complex outermembrane receptor protein